jgi:hypothetical protein
VSGHRELGGDRQDDILTELSRIYGGDEFAFGWEGELDPEEVLEVLRTVPDGAGDAGVVAAMSRYAERKG